jgi:N-acetylmuramoyl-L-alanine amidase
VNVVNHKLEGVRFVRAPCQSPRPLKPPLAIVMHYTAGHTLENAVRTLTKPPVVKDGKTTGSSAHIVIGRDGAVVQLVAFNRVSWHAGPSVWNGRDKLNDWSIGIELVNLGWSTKELPQRDVVEIDGDEWQVYPEAQLAALDGVVKALLAAYPAIGEVVGHEDICIPRGRKKDPGPAFPMARYRALAERARVA